MTSQIFIYDIKFVKIDFLLFLVDMFSSTFSNLAVLTFISKSLQK